MKQLYAAMAKAFAEIESATKDKLNPHFKSKYADLGSVVDTIKPALAKHGLFFVQATHEQDGGVCVETLICHESGEQMSGGKLFVPASKQDAQGYGSALTYARRYSLMAAFGVPAEDDDGNAAAKAKQQQEEAARKLRRIADACIRKFAAGDEYGAYEEYATISDADERVAVWGLLKDHSDVRSAIKRKGDEERQKEAA
jgi:hypothetical protein